MSAAPLHPRAEAESLLKAAAALARRFELIHANIRDGRTGTVSNDLDHAVDEASRIVTRATLLQGIVPAAEGDAP